MIQFDVDAFLDDLSQILDSFGGDFILRGVYAVFMDNSLFVLSTS